MFVVAVEFEIAHEQINAFRDAVVTQARNSLQRESACHQFDVCFDPERPEICFLYEKYDDRSAFDAHRETEHFAHFNETVTPWVRSKSVRLLQTESTTVGG